MSSPTANNELNRLIRLLRQLAKLAEHASLSGALSGGAPDAIQKYNSIVDRLNGQGYDLGDLFPHLPLDASFDSVGVAAKLLSSFIMDEDEERSSGPPNIVIGTLGSLSELDKLKDLGQQIKDSLPEWMRERSGGRSDSRPETQAEPGEADTVRVNIDVIPMPDLSAR